MGEDGGFAMGYALGQDSNGGGGSSNGNGGFGDFAGTWGILALLLILGGIGGFGGRGGGILGGGSGGGGDSVSAGFAWQGLDNGIRSLANGICDSTFALNNSIMSGFHGVDNAICTLGYQNQQGFNTLGYAIKDCCCETQRLIERGFCDTNYNFATQTRDIIENANNNTRAILDFLTNEKLDSLRAENQNLRLRASQADQNAVIRAAIDASTAEIIRRTGNECPIPSYLVQPPTPVNFPINGCGTVQFGNYGGYGNNCGCGCGCN